MEPTVKHNFLQFLKEGVEKGGFHNEDIISIVMPLLEEVMAFHEAGKVAPLKGLQHVLITNGKLDIDEEFTQTPTYNNGKLSAISKPISKAFNIVNETRQETDIETSDVKETNLSIQLKKDSEITKPVYVPGYISYEQLIGHHDALTDIFVLGLIMGSLSTGLDLSDNEDLNTFVDYRTSLAQLRSNIHPTIANVVMEMTDLDRKKRARDLHEIIEKLKNYRDYNPEKEIDLTSLEGFKNQDTSTRNKWILSKLKSRLFDISRRNRLLYFKPSSKFLHLTSASVPTTLHYQNIDINNLFIWNEGISSSIINGKQISLSKFLKTEDNPYIPSILDKIRSESIRNINEYGFSHLRLTICSLNWYNLRDDKFEKINSPLLLVPVEIKKKKGVKDQYTLDFTGNEAEVNPALVYWLKELYDIKLPDSILLESLDMNALYNSIQEQIKSNNSGIRIEFVDKPRLKMIHSLAKQTLSQFNRKLKRNRNLSHYLDVDYSYQPENFLPLGLAIFKQKIEPVASFLEFLVNEDIKPSTYHLTNTEKERNLYTLDNQGEINPYTWEFDLCNMTLGNFNYKKMSLVRDYNEAIDENINDPIFEQLFSDKPKEIVGSPSFEKEEIKERYHIVSCDPTQAEAIKKAKKGASYIIQGPPGTGKSQTITNLIADYIAREKRVLFVCEKRAAIDVVFHRLKQQNLDELCCLIHDSQSDKKEFIMNLKETYSSFQQNKLNFSDIERDRNKIIEIIKHELAKLERYNETITKEFSHVGTSALKLIERVLTLKDIHIEVPSEIEELIPAYKEWLSSEDLVNRYARELKANDHEPYISAHPASLIRKEALFQEHPVNYIQQLATQLEDLLEYITNELQASNVPDNLRDHFTKIKHLISDALQLKYYAENGNLFLYNIEHSSTKQFEGVVYEYKELQNKIAEATAKNSNWEKRFSEEDLKSATEQLDRYQGSFLSFINPGFWKLKKIIRLSYNFSKHDIKPSFKHVLEALQAEYNLIHQSEELQKKAIFTYKIKSISETWNEIENFRKEKDKPTLSYLGDSNKGKTILELCRLKEKVESAHQLLDNFIEKHENKNIIDLLEEIENIRLSLKSLPELLPLLKELHGTSKKFQSFIKEYKFTPDQFEKLMAENSLKTLYSANKEFQKTESADIHHSIRKIELAFEKLHEINAHYIRAKVRMKFLDNLKLSSLSVSGLSNQEREFKKSYTEGRKILEHEFGKSMRYKSIRDLASKESGKVIQDLKPVWLMSPLSVSDTLPLNPEYFDVVIFDEASQITLEEGIPPVFRGKQTIIVGDEMQMPPSNFFGSSSPDDDDDLTDEENEAIQIDADSLLTQGTRKLQDVMLGWHYRSKYESLISFSNAAFYNRSLLTIPDHTLFPDNLGELNAKSANLAEQHVDALYNRSISFHYMENGIYEKRTNTAEAEYIAALIKSLLTKEVKQSIGVVAFSQEQQYEIEHALNRLSIDDKIFESKLEDAFQRQEDGQFSGLFIKNLENVQGDERDIIIMSICYGYDHNKRMLMNFGPINRKGGEKRLNVIFSRAKIHMAVITSIKHTDIKNEHNEGANYFKKFLQYAESVSNGALSSAHQILESLSKTRDRKDLESPINPIVLSIAKALNTLGYETDLNIGQSHFRCDIGVKSKENNHQYCLGLLVDTEEHYSNDNLLEQYVLRPSLLRSFQWNIIQVFSKDWLHHSEKVMLKIKKALKGEFEEEEILDTTVEKPNVEVNNEEIAPQEIPNASAPEKAVNDHSGLYFQRFTFKEGTSDKFWEIAQDGKKMIVRFGKSGTKGQENTKTFETEEQTKTELNKVILQKVNKGYKPQ